MTMRCSLSFTSLILLACSLLTAPSAAIAGDLKEDPQVARLRAELTSKNPEPTVKNGIHPAVVITKDFSWAEQARVRGVISRLAKNPTEELVIQLLELRDSNAYCVSTINDNEFIHKQSVSRVATQLAGLIIEIPVNKAFVGVPSKETNPYQSSIQLYDVIKTPDAEKLFKEDGMKLYQVQLKFLEANKAALQKKYPDDKVAAEVIRKIDANHKTISESQKPMLQPIGYPILEEYFDEHELRRAKVTTAPSK